MSIIAYLNFKGNCREAVEFYAEVFGTEKPSIMAFGDMPPNPEHPIPEEAKNWVMHAMLMINGSPLMFSDVFPGMPFAMGNNINLMVHSKDADEVKTWFNKLKEGGQVGMELQETFWSKLYGSVTDKFGIEWQVNLNNEEAQRKSE
ncbi:VOC family protein [Paenibacillus sp. sgz302251]|uniref:VOC family protein n=1 Tax=Paenibacillus sp. sgz302251 TaxID=3414493 RepID=UPI003C7E2732